MERKVQNFDFVLHLYSSNPTEHACVLILQSKVSWIEKTFHKRDCVQIIPSSREPHRCLPGCQICQQLVRCCCGRLIRQHAYYASGASPSGAENIQESERWTADRHTVKSSTDSFGTINFQCGSHGYKAKFVRLSNDSKVEDILQLMIKEWHMKKPNLLISVHGGMQKFELHPRFKEAFGKGFVKAAVSTGAWIFTGGTNNGVAAHIGDAIKEYASRLTHNICIIGVAPWGIIEGRQDLIGNNVMAPYQTLLSPLSKLHVLNNLHSHFLLVDDGTVGRSGGEMNLRRELESKTSLQQFHATNDRRVPMMALILEGGPKTILTVLEYLQQSPPVPVVVCDGTGRAADLLAYVYKHTESSGLLPDGMESNVISKIKKTFTLNKSEAVHLFQTLMCCMQMKELITVLHIGPDIHQEIDVDLLKALLKGNNISPIDRLHLTLVWDRVDIAKNHIFVRGQQWLTEPLEQAMMDALIMDRVAFVKLLIENGVSMHKFLTLPRLDKLYNVKSDTNSDTLLQLIWEIKKSSSRPAGGTSTHPANEKNLGRVVTKNKTRHTHFIQTAQPYKPKTSNTCEVSQKTSRNDPLEADSRITRPFPYPFNDLLVWAVLTKRQKMALFFWQHGEESMAKALVATKLYRAMYQEARQSDIIDDSSEKLNKYSKEFGELAVELLDQSFKQNELMAMKLLTYELKNWSKSTCLKLAVSSRLRTFVSHTCTQMLLNDMWMGRLNMRKNAWYKVISGILFPPIIPLFDYKSKTQMSHIPQSQDDYKMTLDDKEEITCSVEGIALEAFKETFSNGDNEHSTGMRNEGKPKRVPLARRFYAFYHAPIVKFWFNALAYIAFLMLYAFVVLVKMENLPSVQEWIVIMFIFTTGVEKIREILMSEAGKLTQKLRVWFSSYLNINDTFAIITFLVGFGLRFGERDIIHDNDDKEDYIFIAGRLIYCLNIIFWFVKLVHILSVNQDAGPYVLIIGKMVSSMFFIVVIMAIILIAYGIPRKAILYPHEMPSWSLAKDVLFHPYFMIYGEIYAYEIDVCANDTVVPFLCGTGTWITPFLQAVYLFVQYIIMVNLLIALFNCVYLKCKSMSDIMWKFQRYHLIMVHHSKPVLPPPFIVLSYVTSLFSCVCLRKQKNKAHWRKLYLTEEEQKTLHEFEEHCVGIYLIYKEDKNNSKPDERIRVTSERTEHISKEMDNVGEQVMFIKRSLQSLDKHIGHLQDLSGLTFDSLKTLTAQKALENSRSLSAMSCDLSLSRYTSSDGLSAIWKRSNTDLAWGCPYTQPGLERNIHPRASKSHRKSNIPDGDFVNSSMFQRVDSVPDSQKENHFEDKNVGLVNNHKSRTFNPTIQTHSKSETRSQVCDMKSALSKNGLGQIIHPCSDANSSCKNTCGKDGYINCGFIDDTVNDHNSNEKIIMDCRSFPTSIGYLPHGVESLPHSHDQDIIHKEKNRFTGFLHKLWPNSRHKHNMEKQMSIETNSSEAELYTQDETNLRRTQSCTELTSFNESSPPDSPDQIQMNSTATSHEDFFQTDSEAALLKESLYSRYSSNHNKSPSQEQIWNGFGSQFNTSKDTTSYYTAVERNNLYRLSKSIPFTPLPPKGELFTVYRLEESSPHILNNSMASWSHQGFYAKFEFKGKEEMGGGLRRASKVACTWSEYDILKSGHFYIIKSFLPEVVNTWSRIYKEDTVLQLCLREIQQQRAAQKLLFAFNQMKPKSIPYSPRFLEVFLMYCHSAGQWFTVEECITGRFRKYNNNTGNENVPTNKLEKTMLAFSHWTYEYTRGEFLVLDLQGVGENLTDPSVIKAWERRSQDMIFGPANLGDDAIKNFCSKHRCNTCCRNLKLTELKRTDYNPDEALILKDSSLPRISPGCTEEESPQQPIRVML
ncbi:transient receptor potential cation channel subfamily M member 7 isoform X3 [Xenopus laevis]|uniref:non-specific serine/threonine protein kinase n=1 Tax=Xenopus laevis TaxID=8355 RepID=A0A8J1MLW5_XENLA|nr:transient receptor potential cation channel subfamily M member 7 isoform X3 [Xenopus laevis]